MTYVGATPTTGDFKLLDSITTSSTTTFNLRHGGVAVYPQSANHCLVVLNGILQTAGSSFNIVNDTIVFASSLSSSDVINQILVLGNVNDIGVPSDDTVSTAKIQSLAVSQAKIAGDAINADKIADDSISEEHLDVTAITGPPEKTSLVDADKFLISDSAASNALKYVQKSNLPSGTHVRVGGSSGSADVADITYDNILSNDYYAYRVIGMMETTADAYMEILLRIGSSGSNGNASGQYRQTWNGWASSSTDSYLVNSGDWGSGSIKPMSASRTNDGDDDHGIYFDMMLYTRYLNKTYWRINSQMLNNDKSRIYGYENVGWQSATGAITGFNFYFNTGSIDNHRIDIYGVQSG